MSESLPSLLLTKEQLGEPVSNRDIAWAEMRVYAEAMGIDFDELVSRAAEVVSNPVVEYTNSDIDALVANEMAYYVD